MKNSKLYIVLLVGALAPFAVTTLASKLTSDGWMPSCCARGLCKMTATSADVSTNATPDLLKTCPVSSEKLGEMGKPLVFAFKNQEVKLCCEGCKKDFDKDPEKYLKLIRAGDKK